MNTSRRQVCEGLSAKVRQALCDRLDLDCIESDGDSMIFHIKDDDLADKTIADVLYDTLLAQGLTVKQDGALIDFEIRLDNELLGQLVAHNMSSETGHVLIEIAFA